MEPMVVRGPKQRTTIPQVVEAIVAFIILLVLTVGIIDFFVNELPAMLK